MKRTPVEKHLAKLERIGRQRVATAECLSCRESYTRQLAWFEKKNLLCPKCGGAIDKEALIDDARVALEFSAALTKSGDRSAE